MVKDIIIVSPRGVSGGSLALDTLCSLLSAKGYNARVFKIAGAPKKKVSKNQLWMKVIGDYFRDMIYPLLIKVLGGSKRTESYKQFCYKYGPSVKKKRTPIFDRDSTIVVYPENIYGNILNAKHVIRWFLNINPFKGMDGAYGENELFVAYREIFNDKELNPDVRCATLFYFNNNLYKQYNFGKRKGNCYIVRKGCRRADLPEVFDGPIIDSLSEEDKVKVFNECEYCYSYDLQTYYSTIASVCGCKSIVVFEPGKTAYDYYSEDEVKNHVGVSYGNSSEEIEYAANTRNELLESLDYSSFNEKNINKFIGYMEDFFSNRI